MANIPVERTGGAGIWPWLLGLLALVFVVWLGLELVDDEPDADEIAGLDDNVGVIDDVELGDDLDATPITTVGELYPVYGDEAYLLDGETAGAGTAEDDDTRIGRTVDLNQARVLNVVGDSAFYVGNNDDQRVLIVLESLGESELGAGGSDGRFNIDQGETLSLDGTVARYEEGARGTSELSNADRARMLEQGLYVKVNSASDVEVMNDSSNASNS